MIIIDGHNLIGAVGSIKLSDPKAKEKLLYLLDRYQKIIERKLIVIFDGKATGEYEFGQFKDIDIQYPTGNKSADDVIKKFIDSHRNQHGLCIISSDNEIKSYAKRAHIPFQDSKNFANEIKSIILDNSEETEKYLSPISVDEWLDYFNKRK